MKPARSLLLLGAAALALLALLVVATPAAAQSHSVSVDYTMPPTIEPGTSVTVPVNVTYSWTDGAGLVAAPGDSDTTVNVSVATSYGFLQAWASVSLNPQELTFTPGAQAGEETQEVDLNIVVTQDAPAYIRASMTVTATAEENGQLDEQDGSLSGNLEAAFAPSVTVVDTGVVELAGSGEVRIPVQNAGNGPVRVWVKSVQAPDGMTATPGEAVILGLSGSLRASVEPHAAAGHLAVDNALQQDMVEPAEAGLVVNVEGSGEGLMSVEIAYGPSQDEEVESASTQSQVQVRSSGLPILPILLLVLVAAAAGGGYVLWSKRREEEAEEAPAPEGDEPVLVPVDEEDAAEADEEGDWTEDADFEAAADVEEMEGEEWVEVDEDEPEEAASEEAGEADEDEWVFDDEEE